MNTKLSSAKAHHFINLDGSLHFHVAIQYLYHIFNEADMHIVHKFANRLLEKIPVVLQRKSIFVNVALGISIKISLNYVSKDILTIIQYWCR